ncbi:MAG TPA: type II toxin-antitoxin system RelE/ParE family toxin [Gemmataceae bacterium]|jgi:mRNA-degrading endonuclease RelE of RelBE toxin-antitoxin system|nr:type II toxin-antitoxin system RelE/ParE family toxin [Gemmataceae bacterium]
MLFGSGKCGSTAGVWSKSQACFRQKMAFKITITEDAERQLRSLPAREQRLLEAAIQSRLLHQPTTPTKAIKQLRPNPFAEFELRAGDLRILYNVEGDEVVLLIVGRKEGNALIVEGEEFHGHQDHPAKPSGNGIGGNSA